MKTNRNSYAKTSHHHGPNHLQQFMLQHDPIYADNYARTDKGQVLVLRYQFNSSLNRLKRAGLIGDKGQPVFRNAAVVLPGRRN